MHSVISVCVVLFYVFAFYVEILSMHSKFQVQIHTYLCMSVCVFQVYSVFLMQFVQGTSVVVCVHTDMYTLSLCRAI